jgi:predicted regulator of Ras-like GTPase activity (Roadblock/LC7/MglB family)
MMDVDTLASTAFSRVPGARLAGVVDMTTGMFVALEAGNLQQEELDLLAVSAREILAGAPAAGLRHSFAADNDPQQLKEVIVIGEKTTFLICRANHLDDTAIVVACDRREHLGLITMEMAKIRDNAGNA